MDMPNEPIEIKKQITELRNRWSSEGGGIDWDPLAVWFGNTIQKYLWDTWKYSLKKKGFTWQKFLKLLSYKTEDIILWIENDIKWEKFVKNIDKSIDGPIGRKIIDKK